MLLEGKMLELNEEDRREILLPDVEYGRGGEVKKRIDIPKEDRYAETREYLRKRNAEVEGVGWFFWKNP